MTKLRWLALMGLAWTLGYSGRGFEFDSRGGTSLLAYLNQDNRGSGMPPGYRFGFDLQNQIYSTDNGHIFLDVANSTVISRQDTTAIRLEKIRYRIEPGHFSDFGLHELSFSLSHECIHLIDQPNEDGAVFWNSLRLRWGTKGSAPRNQIPRMLQRDFHLRNSWDYALGAEAFLHGNWLYWIDQNHNYRYRSDGLLQYNWNQGSRSGYALRLSHEMLLDANGKQIHKGKLGGQWILLGTRSVVILSLDANYWDQTRYDNEDRLVSIGFSILH